MVNVPGFRELSGKSVYEQIVALPLFKMYLPDVDQVKKPLNRQYVYNVSHLAVMTVIDGEHPGPAVLRGEHCRGLPPEEGEALGQGQH